MIPGTGFSILGTHIGSIKHLNLMSVSFVWHYR